MCISATTSFFRRKNGLALIDRNRLPDSILKPHGQRSPGKHCKTTFKNPFFCPSTDYSITKHHGHRPKPRSALRGPLIFSPSLRTVHGIKLLVISPLLIVTLKPPSHDQPQTSDELHGTGMSTIVLCHRVLQYYSNIILLNNTCAERFSIYIYIDPQKTGGKNCSSPLPLSRSLPWGPGLVLSRR